MSRGTKAFDAVDVGESTGSSYPEEFQHVTEDRFVQRLTDVAALSNFAVNIVRLAPGGQSSCRHAHSRQDEFVYVLDGELVLETDAGRQTVGEGTCVGFPAGTGDAHRFVNESGTDARFLVVGDRSSGDIITYPDVDLHGELDDTGRIRFTRKDGTAF